MSVELLAGDDRAVIDPAHGGRLSSLVAGGAERLVGRVDDPFGWGCFPMVPWAGRVAGARISAADLARLDLAAAGPADRATGAHGIDGDGDVRLEADLGGHAMHGVAADLAWEVVDATRRHCHLRRALPTGRWPFGGTAEQLVTLDEARLTWTITVHADDRAMPAAVGWHPWFARPRTGDVTVRVASDTVLVVTGDLIPTGEIAPVGGDLDLRGGPALADRRLDHCYVDVAGPAEVTWPDLVLRIGLPVDPGPVVVHTPARGFCVEPQTAWPDPFAHPDRSGVTTLAPGRQVRATTTWAWRPR